MALQDIVEQAVAGLGYELVDIERSAGGLLRVTIDWPWVQGNERFINVEDCEKLTRQLHFALEVEGIEYRRLEVSSPGIDRPLRKARDFERFCGETIDVTLRAPLGAVAASGSEVSALRKKFRGRLEQAPAEPGRQGETPAPWQIVWSEEPPPKPGRKPGRKTKEPAAQQVLRFRLDELKEARLAPLVDFKGRKPKVSPQAG